MPDGTRVALLVGAGDAIGAAVARRFALGGYQVSIARRDAKKSQEMIDELGGKRFAAVVAAKDGLRAVAQAMARERGRRHIHDAQLIIDAGVDSPAIHQRMKARGVDPTTSQQDSLTKTSSIAEAYWYLHQQ